MAKYKTKPCEIEAVRWNGINLEEIKRFVGESLVYRIYDTAWEVRKGRPHVDMKIKTLEGDMQTSVGDYIIKGLRGEYYPCKPDVFEKKYMLVNKQTNADRIRAMSDEELAEFLLGIDHYWDDGECIVVLDGKNIRDSKSDIVDWLQSEVEEE